MEIHNLIRQLPDTLLKLFCVQYIYIYNVRYFNFYTNYKVDGSTINWRQLYDIGQFIIFVIILIGYTMIIYFVVPLA